MRAQSHGRGAAIAGWRSSALMDAVDAIADMAQRVQLNGPEPTYASEKLSYALYKSAEALALCGADIGEVITGGLPRLSPRPLARRRRGGGR